MPNQSARGALALAVRNAIRSGLTYANADCEVMEGAQPGAPPPRCGQVFIAVHMGERQSRSKTCLDETYSVYVTGTWRLRGAWDNMAVGERFAATTGFEARMDAIRALIHKDALDYSVTNAANTLLGNTTQTDPPLGFVESLMFQGDTPPRVVGPDWFGADPDQGLYGLAMTLRFGGARRIQALQAMS